MRRVVLVLLVAALGHFDHVVMAVSTAVPSASRTSQMAGMPCEGAHCADARHCRIVASQLDAAALTSQRRDLEAPAVGMIPVAPAPASWLVPLPTMARASAPPTRRYLTTARLRL